MMMSKASEAQKQESETLEAFGAAFAERPLNKDKTQEAREKLRALRGDEFVFESALIVGAFALMTKIVDTTGRKAVPGMVEKTLEKFKSYKQ